ncbi:MAG: type III-B CRISPR module-associated protein Cmr5 [Thermoproteota archaeon]
MASTVSFQQTKEQQRAKAAWEAVNEVDAYKHGEVDKIKKKYRSLVLKSSVLILSNGLGQATAFFSAKSQPKEGKPPSADNIAHKLLLTHLWGWLEEVQICSLSQQDVKDTHKLPLWVTQATSEQYRHATMETLSYLHWLRRFAEAVLPEPEGE